jgi:hypothetical protein
MFRLQSTMKALVGIVARNSTTEIHLEEWSATDHSLSLPPSLLTADQVIFSGLLFNWRATLPALRHAPHSKV